MSVWSGAVLVLITAGLMVWVPRVMQPARPPVVGGFVSPGWKPVEDAFRANVESGAEQGGSLAVYHQGKLVVHLYGGYADPEVGLPWGKTTMSCFFSATKGVAAIVIAVLVERGLLDYDKPVATYWPEFAQHGKDKLTVAQLMSHQAGLVDISKPINARDMVDNPEEVGKILASSEPLWKIGEGHGYHGYTIGLLTDQLVRRVDLQHRSLGQFFSEEIAKPFGIDFFIGLPREEHYRVARMVEMTPIYAMFSMITNPVLWPMFLASKDSISGRVRNPIKEATKNPPGLMLNIPEIREVPLSSVFGIGTAQGMAKLWGILADGGKLDGKTLLKSPQILRIPVTSGVDKVIGLNMTWGRGTNLMPSPEGNYLAGHVGYGGQYGYMNLDTGTSWGYITNHITPDIMDGGQKYKSLHSALKEVIRQLKKN